MQNSTRTGPYYGITTFRNGELVGSKARTPRARVKRYITRAPGARVDAIAKALNLTEASTQCVIDRLKLDGEIYADPEGPYAKWFAGERRATPTGALNSIWAMADSFSKMTFR